MADIRKGDLVRFLEDKYTDDGVFLVVDHPKMFIFTGDVFGSREALAVDVIIHGEVMKVPVENLKRVAKVHQE